MTKEAAEALAEAIRALMAEEAWRIVYCAAGDFSTPGNEAEAKSKLVSLLREMGT